MFRILKRRVEESTPASIRLGADEVLLDGQHRLSALEQEQDGRWRDMSQEQLAAQMDAWWAAGQRWRAAPWWRRWCIRIDRWGRVRPNWPAVLGAAVVALCLGVLVAWLFQWVV